MRFERPHLARAIAGHVVASVVCAVVVLILQSSFARAVTGVTRGPFSLLQAHLALITYWAILGVTYTIEYYVTSRERAVRAAQLEAEVTAARLQALSLQLQPHFLFNTLNAIGALMRDNVEAADLMLTRLSDLLRAALDTSDAPQVPLRRELGLLAPYLEIQQARIGSRLALAIDIDRDALEIWCRRCSCSRSSKTRPSTRTPSTICSNRSRVPDCAGRSIASPVNFAMTLAGRVAALVASLQPSRTLTRFVVKDSGRVYYVRAELSTGSRPSATMSACTRAADRT